MWRDRVARAAANYLNQFMGPDMILGIAVSHMVNQISACLTPKSLLNVQIVQLNGGEYVPGLARERAGNLIAHVANNYEAIGHLFSVPSFFDFLETREVLWKESAMARQHHSWVVEKKEGAELPLGGFRSGDTCRICGRC